MSWLLAVGIAVALVLVSAVLAAIEAALAELPRSDVAELAEDHPDNRFLPGIAANPEGHQQAAAFTRAGTEAVATALLAVWLTQVLAEPWLALVITAAVMLLVHVLLTGSTAKSVARAHPRETLRPLAWFVRLTRVLTSPVADLLTTIGDSFTPGRHSRQGAFSSEEQLLSMVDEATEDEVLDEEDRELIHSIFDFSDRLVREVMVARTDMITIDAQAPLADALRELLEFGISRAPITGRDSDDIRGILYQKDLARELMRRGGEQPSLVNRAESLARPATFVPESLRANELLRRMQRESTHFAIVVDEYGGVAGLVTIEDLIEQLVGEISDEHDRATDDIELLADGGMRISSRMSTSDLGELFDLELEEEDVDTVGGLLGKELGKIPVLGDRAVVQGLEITADRVGRRHHVTEVTVRLVGGVAQAPRGGGALTDSLTGVLEDRGTEDSQRR